MATVTINGVSYSGNENSSVQIYGDKVLIDGIVVTAKDKKTINIEVIGNIGSLDVETCSRLAITGNVGDINVTSGDLRVNGDVDGDVQVVSGDVCCGAVSGKVKVTSGNVTRQ